jgi:hypothetical protein
MDFTECRDETSPRTMCVLCSEVLQTISMARSKLKISLNENSESEGDHVVSFNIC